MISGNAIIPKITKELSTNPIRIYLPSFPLTFRFLTFRDSSGILVTINKDNIRINIISSKKELVNELKSADCVLWPAITTEITARALAGVGSPLKVVACVVSRLNIASRKAAQTGMIAGIISKSNALKISIFPGIKVPVESESQSILYNIIPGATPKLTTSARLSSSFPIAEYDFSNLAEKPSRKSKIIAARISHEAVIIFPLAAKIIAINPAVRLSEVIKFGICFVMIIFIVSQVGSKIKINFVFMI
jgi:hypothetical protein